MPELGWRASRQRVPVGLLQNTHSAKACFCKILHHDALPGTLTLSCAANDVYATPYMLSEVQRVLLH